jgi:hypothetical protein
MTKTNSVATGAQEPSIHVKTNTNRVSTRTREPSIDVKTNGMATAAVHTSERSVDTELAAKADMGVTSGARKRPEVGRAPKADKGVTSMRIGQMLINIECNKATNAVDIAIKGWCVFSSCLF